MAVHKATKLMSLQFQPSKKNKTKQSYTQSFKCLIVVVVVAAAAAAVLFFYFLLFCLLSSVLQTCEILPTFPPSSAVLLKLAIVLHIS